MKFKGLSSGANLSIVAFLVVISGSAPAQTADYFPSFADEHTVGLWLFDETDYPYTTLTDAPDEGRQAGPWQIRRLPEVDAGTRFCDWLRRLEGDGGLYLHAGGQRQAGQRTLGTDGCTETTT